MSAHAWNQRYATGIESIDVQHRALFRSARELHHAYRAGKVGEVIPDMLDQLMSYCLTHFEDEETHMEKFAFPGLQVHRHEHRNLMAQVDSLRERYAKGESQVPMELSILVTRWLKFHIKEHDQVFADFLHQRVPDAF